MSIWIYILAVLGGVFIVIAVSGLLVLTRFSSKGLSLRLIRAFTLYTKTKKISDPKKKRALLEKSCRLFQKAENKIPAGSGILWNFWGNGLRDLAELETCREKKRELLEEACARHEAAVAHDKDTSYILQDLGYCLMKLSGVQDAPERERALLAKAVQQLEQAGKGDLKTKSTTLDYLGWTLAQQAELEGDTEKKQALLQQARSRYEEVLVLEEDNERVHRAYGIVLMDLADLETDETQKRELLLKEIEQCRQVLKSDPADTYLSLCLAWGLRESAEIEQNLDAKRALLQEACEALEARQDSEIYRGELYANWALFLTKIARLTEDTGEQRSLLNEACVKLQEAARHEDAHDWIWELWGDALRELAEVQDSEEERRRYLEQAMEKGVHAVSLDSKTAAYNCACCAALLGNMDDCRQWLTQAEQWDALPSLEHIQTDADLDGIRETPWFQELLTRRKSQEP